MNPKILAALGTYGRALLACIIAEITISGVPASNADLVKIGNAIWVAFLPVIIRALNPNDSAYGVHE
jgi:hypothetical protein